MVDRTLVLAQWLWQYTHSRQARFQGSETIRLQVFFFLFCEKPGGISFFTVHCEQTDSIFSMPMEILFKYEMWLIRRCDFSVNFFTQQGALSQDVQKLENAKILPPSAARHCG